LNVSSYLQNRKFCLIMVDHQRVDKVEEDFN
jgi:hypothetical protein